MGGFLPSALGHQSKYSSHTHNFILAKLFSIFYWILHFVASFIVVLSTKIIYFYGLPWWLVSKEFASNAKSQVQFLGTGGPLE